MDIVAKITLIAAIVMVGYNLYQLLTSYEAVCDKAKDFKDMAAEAGSDEKMVQKSNFLLTGFLSVSFVALVHFSGVKLWVVATVLLKTLLTMFLSYREVSEIFAKNEVGLLSFRVSKADAFMNVVVGLFVAIVLVS